MRLRRLLADQALRSEWAGREVLVTVRDVSPEKRKVVVDMQQAAANQLMKSFSVCAPGVPLLDTLPRIAHSTCAGDACVA